MIVDCHQRFWDLERVACPWLVPDYIEAFGVGRFMFGSDWPVAILGDDAAVMYGIVAAS